MYNKFNWTVSSRDRINILKNYEPIQPYIMMSVAKKIQAKAFVDIGANIGAYSILMSDVSSIDEIHAFEPSPPTFAELAMNVEINKIGSKIHLHNMALSENRGTVDFGMVSDFSGANGVVGTTIHNNKRFMKVIKVDSAPLDTILKIRNNTVCVKIDVEGHEREVIIGAKEFLQNNRCVIQIENYNNQPGSATSILESYGFRHGFHVGPDYYFLNQGLVLDDRAIIHSFEEAGERLIQANLSPKFINNDRPVRRKIIGGITVEVSGNLARLARRAKSVVLRK